MTFSTSILQQYLPTSHRGVWWIALSGGLDSCVLLHSIVALNLLVKLRALHINHQISPNAREWQEHCAALCASLNIPFTAVSVTVKNTGRGIEDAAREARYAVFEEYVQADDYLLTGHHADDQAETLLLRLMRGAGPRGLSAMARERVLGKGTLYRPLLNFTRSELEKYASACGLTWVDDESNSDDHYDRNFIRNQIMPVLRRRWPHFTQKWQQTSELCAANELLIEELAQQDLMLANFKPSLVGTCVSLEYLESLSIPRRHNLIRVWLRGQGLSTPEQQHLQQIEQQLIGGRQDSEAQVSWGDVSLRVYRQRMYALPIADTLQISAPSFEFATDIEVANNLWLSFHLIQSSNKPLLKDDLPNLHVRFRQGGERCRPVGRGHSQTLKRLLQDYGVEPWLRESLPLIYSDQNLVAVADLWICEGFQADSGYRLDYGRKAE
ncbi:MAG: tRNA lysidine(34) synthetase TilS [Gammaproteobacteria bacterium]|nr:MAG: tRNA lysidine(34) synthetase TilS [Gammaproteobacteria bacterium]